MCAARRSRQTGFARLLIKIASSTATKSLWFVLDVCTRGEGERPQLATWIESIKSEENMNTRTPSGLHLLSPLITPTSLKLIQCRQNYLKLFISGLFQLTFCFHEISFLRARSFFEMETLVQRAHVGIRSIGCWKRHVLACKPLIGRLIMSYGAFCDVFRFEVWVEMKFSGFKCVFTWKVIWLVDLLWRWWKLGIFTTFRSSS